MKRAAFGIFSIVPRSMPKLSASNREGLDASHVVIEIS